MDSNVPESIRSTKGPLARVSGVTKSFGDLRVLDSLDLEVAHGEKVVIVGPSGSGKTTILRVLMTLERPDEGTVEIDGRYLYHEHRNGKLVPARQGHIREVRRAVGMVFQAFNLFPHMTALENVALAPTKVLGLTRSAARELAHEMLESVGLQDKGDHYPAQLSGGQNQRVAIARSLALAPKLLLFDEVTSALDPELIGEVLNVLRRLAEQGDSTMILITHEMGFAREIADRIMMFDDGRIIEEGPADQILNEPTHERTRSFLDAVLHH